MKTRPVVANLDAELARHGHSVAGEAGRIPAAAPEPPPLDDPFAEFRKGLAEIGVIDVLPPARSGADAGGVAFLFAGDDAVAAECDDNDS